MFRERDAGHVRAKGASDVARRSRVRSSGSPLDANEVTAGPDQGRVGQAGSAAMVRTTKAAAAWRVVTAVGSNVPFP